MFAARDNDQYLGSLKLLAGFSLSLRGSEQSIPFQMQRLPSGTSSTQQAFGSILLDLKRAAPEVAARLITVSPDVSSTTNLGGWINKVGVWEPGSITEAGGEAGLVRWDACPSGQHIELGIAEANLVGLLTELGSSWSRWGEPLLPVGTVYDPFVTRALEPWSFGIYSGGQSILVGTPAGIALAPEGGALHRLRAGVRPGLRLMLPRGLGEPREAAGAIGLYLRLLEASGFGTDLICVTSADLLYRATRARAGIGHGPEWILHEITPGDRAAPMVTVIDGHPHTLAFLATVNQVELTSLGVAEFGQSGDITDIYHHYGIDASGIVAAALDLID